MNKNIDKKINHVVEWLRKQVNDSGTNGLVVGLSGGIDSSVVAFLIKKAFPENSIGVIMPCKSNEKDKNDAIEVAKASGLKHIVVDLTEDQDNVLGKVFNELIKEEYYIEGNKRLADANLRARMRMSTLYTVANSLNYLVVGTDNAAELYTGYFTKYGDGGVDILPIANITKREVYEWARHLGVPQTVLDRPPSAGLWEGQTDENEMGTTYNMIDDLLEGKEIPQKHREIIERLNKRTEHKRKMPPAPPKYN
ncbi:NAD(+) synthase [Paramaledivibacter caminithermalis]|jgi:NAD+ synthase|uniref:NH(3)-dependent NAD(+) synthetase n=1 Tax=Paramaledivibacter caminithermalis (strain DSM 15212 / CIP 107654 / DViRD3) TaxID=1121301 RepID=A0A1M6PE43_PARC5|nr:NAD(+) synthase [Paramaledivibacter caminithermalis]SHK06181.1 NH(3)-dependent NAD(+) synthetase [Paramaledivibacter caminithermalis DSM 15212]